MRANVLETEIWLKIEFFGNIVLWQVHYEKSNIRVVARRIYYFIRKEYMCIRRKAQYEQELQLLRR